MKAVILYLFVLLCWTLFIYTLFAFAAWEDNPKFWRQEERTFFVFIGPFLGLGVAAILCNNDDQSSNYD